MQHKHFFSKKNTCFPYIISQHVRCLNVFLMMICVFFLGCSGASKSNYMIDYSTLPELNVSLINEIKDSEKFLPGRLRDLIVTNNGSLIVSDWGNMSIAQFNSDGSFERLIAEKGNGPGELQTFFTIVDSKRDTILIKYTGMSRQLDVYVHDDLENSYFYDKSIISEIENDAIVNIIDAAPGFGYFAKVQNPITSRTEQLLNPPLFKSETVVHVDITGEIISDTLHVLQSPNTLFIETNSGAVTPIGSPPFLSKDHLKYLGNNEYLLSKTKEGAIQVLNQNHEIDSEVIVSVRERSVSKAELDSELKQIPEQFQNKLRDRAAAIKPEFKDVWASEEYFLLHTDRKKQSKEMVLLTRNGDPIGKFTLSDFDEVHEFKNQRIYAINKNPESGHSIRVYEVSI